MRFVVRQVASVGVHGERLTDVYVYDTARLWAIVGDYPATRVSLAQRLAAAERRAAELNAWHEAASA